jgi:K+ transporter
VGELAKKMEAEDFRRVPGTQVFVMRQIDPEFAVARILEQYRRTQVSPENVVILLLDAGWGNPFAAAENITIQKHPSGIWEASARHGYMNEPDVPLILQSVPRRHLVRLGAGWSSTFSRRNSSSAARRSRWGVGKKRSLDFSQGTSCLGRTT